MRIKTAIVALCLLLLCLLLPASLRAQAIIVPAPIPALVEDCLLKWNAATAWTCQVVTVGGGGSVQPLTDAEGIAAYALDPTRVIKFDLSNYSTSTIRTITWPNANVTIPSSFLALPFPDSAVILADAADPTKQVRFELGGITAGATRVITIPDMDLTLGSGGGGGATLGANTFTGNQTIAKNTPQFIMQDTTSGLGSASVATILQKDSAGGNVLEIGNTASGYVVFKAPVGGISLDAGGNGGIFIDAAGHANFALAPVWGSGLGDFSAGVVYVGGTLGVNGATSFNTGTTWLTGVTAPITSSDVGTGTGTAAIWTAGGALLKQTSAARYKESIETWTVPAETLRKFLALSPQLWDYIGGRDGAGGFIADDLASLGVLNRYGRSVLVNYDAGGQPESNRDYAIIGLQHLVIQDLAARVAALEAKGAQ